MDKGKRKIDWKKYWLKYKRHITIAFAAIVVVVLLIILLVDSGQDSPKKDKWQAVFLENSQVYFGKLTISSDFYILEKVYYLQTEKEKGMAEQIEPENINQDNKEEITKLIKLGNELHGPEDAMFIEKSKVMFWENLKNGSNIVSSINAYEEGR
jgi:hypothetical protein